MRAISIIIFISILLPNLFINDNINNDNIINDKTFFVGKDSTYKSIKEAVDNSTPGTTIIVNSGDYYESVFIGKDNIYIYANKTSNVTIHTTRWGFFKNPQDGTHGIQIISNNVTIQNLNFDLNYDGNMGIYINEANKVILENCNFNLSGDRATAIYFRDSNQIQNNKCKYYIDNSTQGFGIYSDGKNTEIFSNESFFQITGERSWGISIRGAQKVNKCNFIINGTECGGISDSNNGNIFQNLHFKIDSEYSDSGNIGINFFNSEFNVIKNASFYSIENGATLLYMVSSSCNISNIFINNSNPNLLLETIVSIINISDVHFCKSNFNFLIRGSESEVHWKGTIQQENNIINQNKLFFYYYDEIQFLFINEYENPLENLELKLVNQNRIEYSTPNYGGKDETTNNEGLTSKKYFLIFSLINGNRKEYPITIFYLHPQSHINITTNQYINESRLYKIIINEYRPAPPQNVTWNLLENSEIVVLIWDETDVDVIEYRIYSNRSGTWNRISTVEDESFTETNLSQNEVAYYELSSFDGDFESERTSTIKVINGDNTPPNPPNNLKISNISHNSSILSWNSPNSEDLIGYQIYIKNSVSLFSLFKVVTKEVKSILMDNLTPNTVYEIYIVSFDKYNNTSTKSQIIEFTTLKDNASISIKISITENQSLKGPLEIRIFFQNSSLLYSINTESLSPFFNDIPINTNLIIKVIPDIKDRGIIGEISGFLINDSTQLTISNEFVGKIIPININLDYYKYSENILGSIIGTIHYRIESLNYSFTRGNVVLLEKHEVIANYSLDNKSFKFSDLIIPGNYYIRVIPNEEDISIVNEKSGFQITEFGPFNISPLDPNLNINLSMDYYRFEIVKLKLSIKLLNNIPVDIGEPIELYLNNSISNENISDMIVITPNIPNKNIYLIDNGTKIIIEHDELNHSTIYSIGIIGTLYFNENIHYELTNSTLTFETVDQEKNNNQTDENKLPILLGFIVGLAVVIILIAVIIILIKRKKKSEEIPQEKLVNEETMVQKGFEDIE